MAASHILLFVNGKEPPGTQLFDVPGTYTFRVPRGHYTLYISSLAGGGGGAGSQGSGDNRPGGPGGAGGFQYNTPVSVTPGSDISVVVGAGGQRGVFLFNSGDSPCPSPGAPGGGSALNGAHSYVVVAGNNQAFSAGGIGGIGAQSDNAASIYVTDFATHHPSGSGRAGYPNPTSSNSYGADGYIGNGSPIDPNVRNNYGPSAGGINLTGYGRGGSNGSTSPGTCPQDGTSGAVLIEWI